MTDDEAWFADRTHGAPDRLRVAATTWWQQSRGVSRGTRLTAAGQSALDSAIAAGSTRHAALDLLAADALITLALLAEAEASPGALGDAARHIRGLVTPG